MKPPVFCSYGSPWWLLVVVNSVFCLFSSMPMTHCQLTWEFYKLKGYGLWLLWPWHHSNVTHSVPHTALKNTPLSLQSWTLWHWPILFLLLLLFCLIFLFLNPENIHSYTNCMSSLTTLKSHQVKLSHLMGWVKSQWTKPIIEFIIIILCQSWLASKWWMKMKIWSKSIYKMSLIFESHALYYFFYLNILFYEKT